MEVETGTSISLINVSTFNQIKNENDSILLTKSNLIGEIVTPKGEGKS